MNKFDEWLKNAIGRGMNPDGAYGYQCKDVADDYSTWLFGNWQNTIRPANAKDAFAKANPDYFIKIANNLNDPNLIPQPGDIITWGASQANPWGHIAVVVSADKTGVVVIEQDGFRNTIPAYQAKRGYIYAGMPCIGWLRPRPEKIIGYTPPAPVVAGNERVLAVKANARDEANISAGIFQTIPAGFKVAMKGYVTNGQAIDGDTVWFVTARSGKYMSRQVFEDKELHDLPDLTPQPAPEPVEPAPAPIPEPQPVPETPKKPENTTSVDTHQTLPKAPQVAKNPKTGDEPSSDTKIQEKKENTMQYDEKAIQEMNKLYAQHQLLVDGVAEADEVKQLVGEIDKRVKLTVYIIGDLLIGAGLILPNIAVALNFGSLQQIQALSSACATAGAFILTMFGIYKSSKNK